MPRVVAAAREKRKCGWGVNGYPAGSRQPCRGAVGWLAAQIIAFQAFIASEEQTCRSLVDAILRYYQQLWLEIPDYFSRPAPSGGQFPRNPDSAALASILEFDCLRVCRNTSAGFSPLIFSWRPAWDEEHGLQILMYQGQVLMVGAHDEVGGMIYQPDDGSFSPSWNRAIMTAEEIAAYEAYCCGDKEEMAD